jgi:hypothetical protein
MRDLEGKNPRRRHRPEKVLEACNTLVLKTVRGACCLYEFRTIERLQLSDR